MVHLGCASPSDPPEDKYTCSLCREPPLPPAQVVAVTAVLPAGQAGVEVETPSEARDGAGPPVQEGKGASSLLWSGFLDSSKTERSSLASPSGGVEVGGKYLKIVSCV